MISLIYSAAIQRHFRSASLAHWLLMECHPFRATHGTSISQQGHHEWGRFPSSRMTMVYLMCLWKKFTHSAVLIAARPLHPSNGHSHGTTAVRNDIQSICGSTYGGGGGGIPLLSPSHIHFILSLPIHLQQPRHQARTTVR